MEKRLDLNCLTVDEFTTVDPITLTPECFLITAKEIMHEKKIRHIPIIENDKVVGLISDRDIHALSDDKLEQIQVKDSMVLDPYTVQATDLLRDVVFEMSSRKVGSALVNDADGRLYGIFTSIDALNSVIELL